MRILLVGVAGLAAACGTQSPTANSSGGDSTAGASGPVNPCTLVSKDQVASAIGLAVADGKASSETGLNSCLWAAADSNNLTTVVISFDPTTTAFDAGKQQANMAGGTPIQTVPNLGQDAFYFGAGDGALLEVKTAKGVLNISVTYGASFGTTAQASPAAGAANQAEVTLAQEALTKL